MSQLVGLANNTKWTELQSMMAEAGEKAPYWRTLDTNGFVYPSIDTWDGDWTYHFRLGGYKYIEWCEMKPRGQPESFSLETIISVCRSIGFEYEIESGFVKIIGYRRI